MANKQLAQEYAISAFPTFVLLHKGRSVDQVRKGPHKASWASYSGNVRSHLLQVAVLVEECKSPYQSGMPVLEPWHHPHGAIAALEST